MMCPSRHLRAWCLLAGLLVAGSPATAGKADDKDPHAGLIGKEAPDVGGNTDIRLNALKGKVVLLEFWTLSDPTKGFGKYLLAWDTRYRRQGLQTIGVTLYNPNAKFDRATGKFRRVRRMSADDARAMLADFAGFHRLPYRLEPLGAAPRTGKPSGYVNEAYKVSTLPQIVLIDRKGKVRLVRAGAGKENAAAVAA